MVDVALTTGEKFFYTCFFLIVGCLFFAWIMRLWAKADGIPHHKDLADDSLIPNHMRKPIFDTSKLPVEESAARLDTDKFSVFEVSHNVLLSKLARALTTEGLVISNTPRGTLRVHELSNWHPPVTTPTDDLVPTLLQRQAG